MKTEKEKAAAGFLYNANYDPALCRERLAAADLCFALNQTLPSLVERRSALLRKLLKKCGKSCCILSPFQCDYGCNISCGENFFANYNCVILDAADVTFGRNVLIGPNCCFTTSGHPLDAGQRSAGLEFAWPITVGDDVWFGAGVTVLPGVTIGSGSIIGAGSLVNRDIPAGVVAAGNPCRVIRPVSPSDRDKYPQYHE